MGRETDIIKQTEKVFSDMMIDSESDNSMMCSLNEAFTLDAESSHNCLGCNLQDDVDLISIFLNSSEHYSIEYFFKVYIMLLHILTMKMREIMRIIGLPPSYRQEDFEVLKTITLWANFYKHPKAFILTHHPKYYIEKDVDIPVARKGSDTKIIDSEFLNKYYRGEDSNKYIKLVSELRNNSNVHVVLPQIDKLTKDYCKAWWVFIKIIKDNQIYQEILGNLTTLQDFYGPQYVDKTIVIDRLRDTMP